MDLNHTLIEQLDRTVLDDYTLSLPILGANPNVLNSAGYSLLHCLIFQKRMEDTFKILSDNYAAPVDINIKDRYGHPPLYYMLNSDYSIDDIQQMIELGADPAVYSESGFAPIHLFITRKFKYALQLLMKYPEHVHFKSADGTPIEIMLKHRLFCRFKADDYLLLVRFGTQIDSKDSNGTTLLKVLSSTGNPRDAQELMILSLVPLDKRQQFSPKLVDYLLSLESIEELFNDLRNNKLKEPELILLAKYPLTKERIIEYLRTQNPENQELMLAYCLQEQSQLNQFFRVQRGLLMTSSKRGTLAQLVTLQHQLLKEKRTDKTSHSNTKKDDVFPKSLNPQLQSVVAPGFYANPSFNRESQTFSDVTLKSKKIIAQKELENLEEESINSTGKLFFRYKKESRRKKEKIAKPFANRASFQPSDSEATSSLSTPSN